MTPLLTYKHRIVAGIANMVVELHGKRLALLLEAIKPAAHCCSPPTGQRLLANELSTRYRLAQRRWESNCSSTLADSRSDYQVALAAMRASGAEALLIGSAHRVPFTPRRRSKRPRRRHHFSTQRPTSPTTFGGSESLALSLTSQTMVGYQSAVLRGRRSVV